MYVRRDKDCNVVSPQPGHVTVQDAYGNTFENWCVDFIGTDKDCNPNGKTGCAPQDPDGLITKWEHRDVENNVRPLGSFIVSPLMSEDFIYEVIEPGTIMVLGMEDDRDLILYNESNTLSLQLEDDTEVLQTATFS